MRLVLVYGWNSKIWGGWQFWNTGAVLEYKRSFAIWGSCGIPSCLMQCSELCIGLAMNAPRKMWCRVRNPRRNGKTAEKCRETRTTQWKKQQVAPGASGGPEGSGEPDCPNESQPLSQEHEPTALSNRIPLGFLGNRDFFANGGKGLFATLETWSSVGKHYRRRNLLSKTKSFQGPRKRNNQNGDSGQFVTASQKVAVLGGEGHILTYGSQRLGPGRGV